MCHTTSEASEMQLCISGTNNGTLAKKIRFLGEGSPRRRRAPSGGERPQRRFSGAHGHPRQPRDLSGEGHHPRPPHHHQGWRGGERRPRRRSDGNFRPRRDCRRHYGRQPKSRPGVAGGSDGCRWPGGDYHHPGLSAPAPGSNHERDVPGQRRVPGGRVEYGCKASRHGVDGHGGT